MERFIYDESNNQWQELKGDYYLPCLTLPETPKIGKFGMLRHTYLRTHKAPLFGAMLMEDKLNAHLEEIDKTANEMVATLVKEMAEIQGVTEKLKEENQLQWVRSMTSIYNSAEELVLDSLIYG